MKTIIKVCVLALAFQSALIPAFAQDESDDAAVAIIEGIFGAIGAAIDDDESSETNPASTPQVPPLGMTATGEYWIKGSSNVNLIVQVNDMVIKVGRMANGKCPAYFDAYTRLSRSSNEFRNQKGQAYIFLDTGRNYVHQMTWLNTNGTAVGLVHKGRSENCI